jgi:hypothetical protein
MSKLDRALAIRPSYAELFATGDDTPAPYVPFRTELGLNADSTVPHGLDREVVLGLPGRRGEPGRAPGEVSPSKDVVHAPWETRHEPNRDRTSAAAMVRGPMVTPDVVAGTYCTSLLGTQPCIRQR